MGRLIAIDPGRDAGYAIFDDSSGELASCGLVANLYRSGAVLTGRVVIELPQVYTQAHSKKRVDPNDLIRLAFEAGRLAGQVAGPMEITTVLPAEWKGQAPKTIVHGRIAKILSDEENRRLHRGLDSVAGALKHNALDAVGIGLWKLGRYRAR